MAIVQIIARFLSLRIVSVLIFLLAVGARLIQVIFFYNPRSDASYQLIAAKNLISGKGVSTNTVSANDLGEILYTPLINWPPGYSFLVAPFMMLTDHYMLAAIFLSAVMAIAGLVFSLKILKLLEVPIYLRNLALLLMGFYINFIHQITSSDAIAIPFFLAALFLFLKMIRYNKISAGNTTGIIILLFLFASVKYLFMPVALIIPAMTIITGWRQSNQKLMRTGYLSFFLLLLGIGSILIYQKMVSGSATYISQPERNFYPENLLEAFPFIPASFIKPGTITELYPAARQWIITVYLIFHLLVSVVLTILLVREFRRKKFSTGLVSSVFYYVSWAVSFSLSIMLAILSIRVAKEQPFPGWFWTYIEEPRYYGLAIILIQLSVFLFASKSIASGEKRKLWLSLIFLFLFIPEIVRGAYFTMNRIVKFNSEEYSWQYEDRFQKYADKLLVSAIRPGESAVVTGSSYYMNHRVSLYSKIPILDSSLNINDISSLHSTKSIALLVILQEKNMASFKKFIDAAGNHEAGRFNDYHFYILHVNTR